MANSSEWRELESLDDAIAFLCGRAARGVRNFWWNLDYDVTAVLKLEPDVLREVTKTGGYEDERFRLSYLQDKLFTIRRKGGQTFYHYDAMQFYNSGLARAALKYLGRETHELKAERGNLDWRNVERIGDYCVWDATATRDLGALLVSRMHKIGVYPKHFISKGNIAQVTLLTKADVPTWRDNPRDVNRFAWHAFRAGWIDLWKRGSCNVWKYDIKKAYPAVFRTLPDFRRGRWTDEPCAESSVGFVRCTVRMRKETPPMLAAWLDQAHYYPTFDLPVRVWLTLDEQRFLSKHADVTPELWRCFVPKENAGYPWRDIIDKLLSPEWADKSDPALYQTSKEIRNSIYGKTVESGERRSDKKVGRLFNVVAGATATARTRVWVAEQIVGNLGDVVAVMTDAVATTRRLHVPEGDDVGMWEVEAEDKEGVFVQPGVYQVGDKDPQTRSFRAIKDLRANLKTAGETLKVRYERPWSARQAVVKNDISLANVFEEEEKEMRLTNHRRMWRNDVRTFPELLKRRVDSSPVPVSLR